MESTLHTGDIIHFKDLRACTVLAICPNGYLIAEVPQKPTSGLVQTYFMTQDFLESAERNKIIRSIKRASLSENVKHEEKLAQKKTRKKTKE